MVKLHAYSEIGYDMVKLHTFSEIGYDMVKLNLAAKHLHTQAIKFVSETFTMHSILYMQ